MFIFGKMAQTGITVIGRLSESWSKDGTELLQSETIARERKLSPALVGKILTILGQHGIVQGTRGPRGGYRLAKDPKEISLYEVVAPFERTDAESPCPLGQGRCGHATPCPLHQEYKMLAAHNVRFLQEHDFGGFRRA